MVRAIFALIAVLAMTTAGAEPRALTVSVAASLTDVMTDLARRHESAGGAKVDLNIGGSHALARQILEGAPVDAFVSADELQMDLVARTGRLVAGSRVPLLSNQLVIIVSKDANVSITRPQDLAASGVRRVAMGQPESVPAGAYGRRWLEQLGLWSAVRPKVVPMLTVRAALAAVREGHADAAIVYATDARSSPAVRVAYSVGVAEGPAIVYPAAVLMGPRQIEALRFLAYLQTPEARSVFENAGFRVLGRR
jgi:molybdate transport system substrate-binding protein